MSYSNGKLGEKILRTIREKRALFLSLCAMVVFVTTYLLVLPAITLDEETAAELGGIDLPKAEQVQKEASLKPAAGEISYEGKGYTVEAAFGTKAGLPKDTELAVTEIASGDEDYDAWCDEALKAVQESEDGEQVGSLEFAKFYDISLLSDGEPVEPDSAVGVSISYDKALEAADADHVRIVHFGTDEEGNQVSEILDPDKVKLDLKEGMMSGTAFAAESFSVYGIVYTVDFHYDTDEKTYDYSIEGGSSILLSELLEELGADVSVEEVADVTFSDPELVEITQEDGDWTLTSLQAFDTEETLTITLNSGEELTIRVTDAQISENVLTADGKNYEITVSFDEAAKIPSGTKLDVTEIQIDSDEYIQYLGRTWSEVNRTLSELKNQGNDITEDSYVNVNAARFFDIKLIYMGEEIEPMAPVQVVITYVDSLVSSDKTKLGVVHFTKDNKIEILKDVETDVEDDATVSFRYEQDSFSVIGTYIQQETHNAETPPLGARHAKSDLDTSLKKDASDELSEKEEDMVVGKASAMPLNTLRSSGTTEQPDTEDSSTLPHPQGNKTLAPNGDGTYTLTLSVKGSSETTIKKQQKKANVLFVMDRSSSMITNTVDDTERFWYYGTRDTAVFRQDIGDPNHDTGKNYQFWGIVDGEYVPLNVSFSGWSNPSFTYLSGSHQEWDMWNGWHDVLEYSAYPNDAPLYVKSKTTRLYAEQDALNDVIGRLLEYNTDEQDQVEVAVISFADHRADTKGWTDTEYTNWVKGTDKSDIMNAVNSTRYASGTNWEEALKYAYDTISNKKAAEADKPEEDYYVVFLTDGEPTNIVGDTSAAQHTGDAGNRVAYDGAKDDALALVRDGYKFYNIFTYRKNEPVKYSKYLTNYAYSNGSSDYDESNTDAVKNYFSDARTIEALNDTFNNIFQTIADTIGHADVSITDTLTTDAMTTTVVEGKTNGYVYTVKDPSGSVLYTVTATGDISSPSVTFNVPGSETKSYTATPSEEIPGLYSITTVEGDEYRIALADIDDSTGELEWDLSPVGILMDDCEYSVSFVVWPNQDAYDYVAALNNGLPGYKWDTSLESYKDLRSTKGYEVGGVDGYPSIVKKSDGTFAVLTNTDQKVHYSVVELKTVNGELDGEPTVNGPYYQDLQTPDPMPLTASSSQIEKVWNIDRDPDILAELLYGHPDNHYSISFDIMQDETTTPYTSVGLGWDGEEGKYIWKNSDTEMIYVKWNPEQNKYVACSSEDEGALPIGTHWIEDFSIATGLMLSETRMTALGLDKTAYTSTTYDGTKYYLLEEGHDYTIDEPDVGFEFDFEAPVYHPMLVDGVLRDVDLKDIVKDENGKVTSFSMTGMSPIAVAQDGRSALEIANTLRGYIHLDKVVVGRDNQPLASDHTAFAYDVVMNNEEAVFIGDSIPWYGISGLFYHDEDSKNYYQAEMRGTQLWLTTEEGGPYKATCPAGFNSKIATVQTITYIDTDDLDDNGNGKEKTIEIYGNQMTPSEGNEDDGYKKVTARLHINQNQTLNIANVPVGTTYSITEDMGTGYQLVNIESDVNDVLVADPDIDGSTISGEIVTNSDNHIIYTNKRVVADIKIKKTNDKEEGLSGAVFQLLIKDNEVYRYITAGDGIGGLGNVTVDETTYESAFQTDGSEKVLTKLPDGEYQLNEVHVPAGYINTSGSIYFKIENGVVTSTTADESDKVALDTSGDGLVIGLLQIENSPGAALPSSGGPGTTWIYLIGSILLLGCGTILVARRRTRGAS